MRKALVILAILITGLLAAGCQAMARPTPQPSPTTLFLAPTATLAVAAGATDGGTSGSGLTPGTSQPTPIPATATRLPLTSPSAPVTTATVSPLRILGLGIRQQLTLRLLPQSSAPAVAQIPGSHILWAEARSTDGEWLRVRDDATGLLAWANRNDLELFGDIMTLPTAAPESATLPVGQATDSPDGRVTGRITSGPLNVRSAPGVDQTVVGQLNARDVVTLIGRSAEGDWLAIRWQDGATGWIAAPYVTTDGPIAALPALARQTTGVPNPAPPLPGKVAFQLQTGGDIYLVNADGSNLRRLTDGLDPALSPDGTRLAFARWASPHGVFVLDLRTGRELRVATANRPRSPTWSPDGSQIAFSHLTRSYSCRSTPWGCLDDEQLRALFGGQDCTVTPWGRVCITNFRMTQAEETGLAKVTLEGRSWQDLPSKKISQSPSWHPAQAQIVYRSKDGLDVTEVSADSRLLIKNPDIGSPVWSPDGRHILVQMYLHDHADLFLLDAAGNTQARLTAPASAIGRAPNNVAPTWSPDGRYILYLSDRDGEWRLYRMNADGSNQVPFLADVLRNLSFRYDFAAERMASWGP